MTDWAIHSVIFLSKYCPNTAQNEVKLPKYYPETITKSS